jgi:hypothetical protein
MSVVAAASSSAIWTLATPETLLARQRTRLVRIVVAVVVQSGATTTRRARRAHRTRASGPQQADLLEDTGTSRPSSFWDIFLLPLEFDLLVFVVLFIFQELLQLIVEFLLLAFVEVHDFLEFGAERMRENVIGVMGSVRVAVEERRGFGVGSGMGGVLLIDALFEAVDAVWWDVAPVSVCVLCAM